MSFIIVLLVVISILGVVAYEFGVKRVSNTPETRASKSWEIVQEKAALISGNNPEVRNAIEFARSDINLLNESSSFYKKGREDFGDYFNDWVDDDLTQEQVPSAVFKTVMLGFGYMAYLDWKSIYDAEDVFFSLNRVLRTVGKPEISEESIRDLESRVSALEQSQDQAEKVVEALNLSAHQLQLEISWFSENGDSYAFFVVDPSINSLLTGVALDCDHKFVSPHRF